MALPVDSNKLLLLCGAPPEAVLDYESGAQKKNRDGEPLYRTEVIVMGFGRPQVVGVRTPREPKGLVTGAPVAIPGFSMSPFTTRDGGTGVLYEASSVEPAKATREQQS
jgi:hypothetical protein